MRPASAVSQDTLITEDIGHPDGAASVESLRVASRLLPSPCSGAALVAAVAGVAAPSQAAPEDSGSGWMVPHEGAKRIATAVLGFFFFFFFVFLFCLIFFRVEAGVLSVWHLSELHAFNLFHSV